MDAVYRYLGKAVFWLLLLFWLCKAGYVINQKTAWFRNVWAWIHTFILRRPRLLTLYGARLVLSWVQRPRNRPHWQRQVLAKWIKHSRASGWLQE